MVIPWAQLNDGTWNVILRYTEVIKTNPSMKKSTNDCSGNLATCYLTSMEGSEIGFEVGRVSNEGIWSCFGPGWGPGTWILVLYTCVTSGFKTHPTHDFPSPRKTPPNQEFCTISPQNLPLNKLIWRTCLVEFEKMTPKCSLIESHRTVFLKNMHILTRIALT